MSLINFLNPKLKPSVECESVCEDGYGVSNLIADDAEQLSRGFLAYTVAKPPVEIVFDFPKAVDLKVIKLWNSNGALRSTAFEVHGKYEGIWERVAYVRDLAKGVDSVTFCYQSDYSSRSNAAADAAAQQQSEKVFFFKTAHKILANTNSLKVIIRATQKCPPVLRKVQVWGLPARSLEKADRELVKTIWSEITDPYELRALQQQQELSGGQRSPSRCVPELNENSELSIPEEFLDAITWELMIFPTVLPSGKVVDQSTIDKHSEVEAKWGRMPSDPFTGLEFTSHRKAILNLALKARIEKFLMENSEQFKTVPRSLGSTRVRRSRNRHASQFASLNSTTMVGAFTSLSSPSSISSSSLASSYKKSSATATLSSPLSSLPAKRAKLSLSDTSSTYRASELHTTSTATQTTATATAAAASASATSSSSATSSAAGIEQALQQALQKITRFTRPPAPAPAETQPASCISCQSEQFAYEIQTCKHLVCRVCLVQLTKEQMCRCKTSFRSADVERYHKL